MLIYRSSSGQSTYGISRIKDFVAEMKRSGLHLTVLVGWHTEEGPVGVTT